jgi:hypothetical protein
VACNFALNANPANSSHHLKLNMLPPCFYPSELHRNANSGFSLSMDAAPGEHRLARPRGQLLIAQALRRC